MRLALASTERLSGEFGATLGAASREDGAAGASAHAKAEAVLLGATTVVRLEGTLAHSSSPAFGSPRRDAMDAPAGKLGAQRAGVNLLKLRPRSPLVKPGEPRADHSANTTVFLVPSRALWTDTPAVSNPSPSICPRGRHSLPCETSYPQPCTRNPGPLPESANRSWMTL